jgi:hypothetical protein
METRNPTAYPVYQVGSVVKTLRSFGQPGRRRCLLLYRSQHIQSISVSGLGIETLRYADQSLDMLMPASDLVIPSRTQLTRNRLLGRSVCIEGSCIETLRSRDQPGSGANACFISGMPSPCYSTRNFHLLGPFRDIL